MRVPLTDEQFDVLAKAIVLLTGLGYADEAKSLARIKHDEGIIRHYRDADRKVEAERQAWLAAGNSPRTFIPKTLID